MSDYRSARGNELISKLCYTIKITLYVISSFHFQRWNQFKVNSLACSLRTRNNLPKFYATFYAG